MQRTIQSISAKGRSLVCAVLILAFLLSLLTACGDSADGGAVVSPSMDTIDENPIDETRATTETTGERYPSITIALSADPQNFAPFNSNEGSKDYVYRLVYEALFDCDDSVYYPVLAKGYTVVDDYHWDVEIYDYIYDSQGNHITASDVVYSYEATLDSGYANKYEAFESIEQTGEYTVRFTWTKPIDGVLELEYIFGHTLIFSQTAYESGNFSTQPVGTGPYTMESFTSGSSCVFEARDDYWQTEELTAQGHHSNVQTIIAQVITESAQQVIALQDGRIDFSYSIPVENLSDFTDDGAYADSFSVYRAVNASGRAYYLFGNLSGNSVWSDENFRLAVFYALNSEVIGKASGGAAGGTLALCSPKWTTFYDDWASLENYMTVTDLDLAKEYLDKTDYQGEELVLLVENNEVYKNMATMIVALLDQIGINVALSTSENTTTAALQLDDTAYDLSIMRCGSPNLINSWNKLFNNADYDNGMAAGFNADSKLLELYSVCNSVTGYNLENMTELMQYVVDNAYAYAFAYEYDCYVYNNDIASLGFATNGKPRINDCVFYLD